METQIVSAADPRALRNAIDMLQKDQLVTFPTDTVYGIGGMVFSSVAIDRLYEVKGRDHMKAIPVLIGDLADLEKVTTGMEDMAWHLAARFWPGPLTLIVHRHPALPENLSPYPTVGVRMPDHPVALNLMRIAGPMAVSSANLSNQPSADTAEGVFAQLGGRIPLILDGGRTKGGLASTVVDCTTGKPIILRPGPLTKELILDVLAG